MRDRNIDNAAPELKKAFLLARRDFNSPRAWRHRYFEIKISWVLRTTEEQKSLYWSTRNPDGSKIKGASHVTTLDGVHNKSRHQANENGKSEAIDFFVVRKSTGKADWMCAIIYSIFGRFCKRHGLVFGGDWKTKDYCHVQLR